MPSKSQRNHLLIIEDDKGRREFALVGNSYSVGRDPQCDIRLISQFVSRRHATLLRYADEEGEAYYRIIDGDAKHNPSVNGLLINGRKLQTHVLANEDEIVFGPKVRAIYYALHRDTIVTVPPDEFDITLISPNMIGEPEDSELQDRNLESSKVNGGQPETTESEHSNLENDKLENGSSENSKLENGSSENSNLENG